MRVSFDGPAVRHDVGNGMLGMTYPKIITLPSTRVFRLIPPFSFISEWVGEAETSTLNGYGFDFPSPLI
jgi:hypothetical protein